MIELGDNMAKKKKKKLKLKKKNFAIFLLCITLIIGSISYGIYILSSPHAKKTKEMNNTKEEIKLQQLNHIEKKIDYFNNDYLDRYIDYKNKNKDWADSDIEHTAKPQAHHADNGQALGAQKIIERIGGRHKGSG